MAWGKKISNFIRNRKMTTEERIKYLTYLNSVGLNFNSIPENYVSEDGILVENVIKNLNNLYMKNKLTVKQIIKCEDIGIEFEAKQKNADKIGFLKKAIDEGIVLSDITTNQEKYANHLIFRYIVNLRQSFEKNELNEQETTMCEETLKIILPNEEKKKIVLKTIKESALKNIMINSQIKETLNIT